jgi:EKC/KEOPS complex subunit CGI121/TPRKB
MRRYGVSDTTSVLFVVRISGSDTSTLNIQDRMRAVVSGTLIASSVLETVTDWTSIKRVRRCEIMHGMLISAAQYHKVPNEVNDNRVVDNIVVSMVAMKSVA